MNIEEILNNVRGGGLNNKCKSRAPLRRGGIFVAPIVWTLVLGFVKMEFEALEGRNPNS